MKFVFFGSPVFAKIVFEKLAAAGMLPEAIVCNPDRPAGRHQTITAPEIKKYILEKNLPVEILQPENPSDIAEKLKQIAPDFFVVAAYGKLLKKDVLEIPKLGTIGIHSSLLPKYRGMSPIHGAIMGGEKETGATIFLIDEKMDHGPVLAQCKVGISENDTHETLYPKIWGCGGETLAKIIPDFAAGKIKPESQNESGATYTKRLSGTDGYIEPADLEAALGGNESKTDAVDRKIRAFAAEPGAWTLRQAQGKPQRMKILAAGIKNGKLVLKKIQIEGQKPIEVN